MSPEPQWHDGELAATISNTVVRALARTTGRGPTKAKTTLGDNGVFVVLQDTLTRGEQTLTDAGEDVAVLDLRRRWQRVMQADVSREIEEITGRKVIGFMSDNHIDPDLAVEVFILEPLPADRAIALPSSPPPPGGQKQPVAFPQVPGTAIVGGQPRTCGAPSRCAWRKRRSAAWQARASSLSRVIVVRREPYIRRGEGHRGGAR